MNDIEFNRIYFGVFGSDQRSLKLLNKIDEYYKNTPESVDNRTSHRISTEFSQWCAENGYTRSEVSYAKRNFRSKT